MATMCVQYVYLSILNNIFKTFWLYIHMAPGETQHWDNMAEFIYIVYRNIVKIYFFFYSNYKKKNEKKEKKNIQKGLSWVLYDEFFSPRRRAMKIKKKNSNISTGKEPFIPEYHIHALETLRTNH